MQMLSQIRYILLNRKVLLRDSLGLSHGLTEFSEFFISRSSLLGECARCGALLVHFRDDSVISGRVSRGGRLSRGDRRAGLRPKVPSGCTFDTIDWMSFVHGQRVARVDVAGEPVFL